MAQQWQENISLSNYTTLKTGGVARYFTTVRTVEEVGAAVRFAEQNGLPPLILGGGSNLLVADAGYPGAVIKIEIVGCDYVVSDADDVFLTCGAGEALDEVVADTVRRGYWGLENLSAIPGTIGATPVQNVGAYGVEVKDVIERVEVYDTRTHTVKILSNADCCFSYRHSIFKTEEGASLVITKVTFRLSKLAKPKLEYEDLRQRFRADEGVALVDLRAAIIKIRDGKFPDWRVVGTAGSFFKNPVVLRAQGEALRAQHQQLPLYAVNDKQVKLSLGYILDKIGNLKGYRLGNVGLYEKQALVLINHGNATTDEIVAFVAIIKEKVKTETGIEIEEEVRLV